MLLAEDDAVAREMTARLLEHGGFRVLTARHGGEAVRIFEQHGDEIDLAILDLIMPVLGRRRGM